MSLRARLAKLEKELQKPELKPVERTPAEIIRCVLHELTESMFEIDREAIEHGRAGEFFDGLHTFPGGILKLAERGNRLAQIALKMGDFFESFIDAPDLVAAGAAKHLLYGLHPIEQQHVKE